MFKNRFFALNLTAQMVVFFSNIAINLILTPYVIESLGTEAYGFIGLINNFIGYSSIITVALNSLAGRYITLAYHRGDMKAAREYYSSVFLANLLMSAVLLALSLVLTINISNLLNIPAGLEADVKLAVCLSAINTVVSMLAVVFAVAAFIKNQLYWNSVAQMIAALVRAATMVILFACFRPHLWYYALTAGLSGVILVMIQKRITRMLCPEFRISVRYFRWNRVLEIIKSGIWITVENLNQIMQTGLDLLITNLFVDPMATGLLSIAKTVPNTIRHLTSIFSSVLHPELARLYAEGNQEALKDNFRFSLRFMSALMIVPLVGFIVFGVDFYRLWLPEKAEEEIRLIQLLSIFTMLPLLVSSILEVLYYANTLTNKIKGSVTISFVFSVLSIITTMILINITDIMPLYIIAATSSLFMLARCIIITPLYAAYVLRLPKATFVGPLLHSLSLTGIVYGVFSVIERYVVVGSWMEMILQCGICGVVGYLIVFYALFNPAERKEVLVLLKKILRRK